MREKRGIKRTSINHLESDARRAYRAAAGVQETPYKPLDRTGERFTDRTGRPGVIVRYGGCGDIDAVLYDGTTSTYWLVTGVYETLTNRSLLSKACKVHRAQVTPETPVCGRCVRSFFF